MSFRPAKLYTAVMTETLSYEFILDELEIRADPFALCELRGRCDLGLGREPLATLHYILSGEGEVVLPGRSPVPIRRGCFVLIPALQSHMLRSYGANTDPLPACRPVELNLAQHIKQAEDSSETGRMVALCARVTIGLRGVGGLIDLIREPVAESVSSGSGLEAPLRRLVGEIADPGFGSRAMIRALLLQCMIDLLRRRLAAGDPALGWMGALKDRSLWLALRRMLDDPGAPHSVEGLAVEAGMSRSTFAKRFADAYGRGPMELLRDLRMRHAATLLSETDLPVKRIAEMAGFRSRSAFTRTFESLTGASPRAFRKE